jgi:hypothetical protein
VTVAAAHAQEQDEDAPAPLPKLTDAQRSALRKAAREQHWVNLQAQATVNRTMLIQSLEAARAYYLNQQLPQGNFVYARDVVTGETQEDDNQVRQAGALWGLACLNRDRPTNPARRAIVRGLDFFYRVSTPLRMGHIGPVYPNTDAIKTGTVALVCLAMTELWRGQEEYLTGAGRGLYDSWLSTYLDYLNAMEMDNGSWGGKYYVTSNQREPISSPYYDGEALLAYCRAARYMGRDELIPRIEASAPLLAARYTVDAWREDLDSDDTKGFFQWGCMAFAEYVEAGWKNADVIADAAMALAYWQLFEYRAHERDGNTAYAVEGLLAAYKVAKLKGNTVLMGQIRAAVESILSRIITWQVGGPAAEHNPFLKDLGHKAEGTQGGIMSSRDSGMVRIDIVQHQVHAMLMALKILYPEGGR